MSGRTGRNTPARRPPHPHAGGPPVRPRPAGPAGCYNPRRMKAVILAGGFGTRLRPLTLEVPKPIVPIFDRPFLDYQVELLRQVPDVDEVVLSLNYRPGRIEASVGDRAACGLPLRYRVEPHPLGTAGAIKFAAQGIDDTVLVLNGDVLTDFDLAAAVARHRERRARATIVLTPVADPSAYGLVETDGEGRVRRFVEKPGPGDVTCDTINAGIYLLEPASFGHIPDGVPWSLERQYFPALVERGETFVAHVGGGYWIDIGTPASYMRAHRDLMAGRCAAGPFRRGTAGAVHRGAGCRVEAGSELAGPCFLGDGCSVAAEARIGSESVVGPGCAVGPRAVIERSIVWRDTTVEADAVVRGAILGLECHVGAGAEIGAGTVLGNRSTVSAHSRL